MYRELIASIFVILCCVPVQHIGDPKALVLSWSWSTCASSQAVETSDLVLYMHCLLYTKWNSKARNQLTSQPIAIIMGIAWATKRNTSAVDDWYI